MSDKKGEFSQEDEQENLSQEQETMETTTKENGNEEIISLSQIEIEKMRFESQDYKDKYFRVLAEAENARKRLIKEKQEMIQYSLQNLICDFLPPIDQMENALKHADKSSDEVKQWSIGFQMILTHFKDVLSNNNVQAYESIGKPFDPYLHEAVEMVETNEFPSGTVVEENLRGYKIGDRVIRPARVKVAKALESNDKSSAGIEEETSL